MKKYLFFFLLILIMTCKVEAKEYKVVFEGGFNIVLDGSYDYEYDGFNYNADLNKITLNNTKLKSLILNDTINELLEIEVINDSSIINYDDYAVEAYNVNLIIYGDGKLSLNTKYDNAFYAKNSNVYIRNHCDLKSKTSNLFNMEYSELIIEDDAVVNLETPSSQALFIAYGILEVNASTLNATSKTNPIVLRYYNRPYYFISSEITSEGHLIFNYLFRDYYTYMIGQTKNVVISKSEKESEKYELKTTDIEGGKIILNKNMYELGERISYTIVPDRGYKYKSDSVKIIGDYKLTNEYSEVRMPESGLEITCEFEEEEKYNISLDYNEGGTFDKDKETILYKGENYILNIIENENYIIKKILINDIEEEINNLIEINNVDKNYNIYIEFEKIYEDEIENINEEEINKDDDIENINEEEIIKDDIVNPNTSDNILIYIIGFIILILLINLSILYIKNML